ncbi:uncharacterized protein FOMMEDRAFT_30088 [Fomitiporia mediterranea MF3/22]|uniref:uncharacterized protein n=1 Tax=Fomitiporia mediterranea (strain MF3/22) TaxID=694068 RepID=UPI00044083CD|nr:uncharacterized protein FOMMEDRAFT_30088 [Fomitiporia mediterranea MF3/22]EJD01380.1 hypothetical protein FOMMEDRAFT_30088 [Fomitiporia mediterranea MF3/22]
MEKEDDGFRNIAWQQLCSAIPDHANGLPIRFGETRMDLTSTIRQAEERLSCRIPKAYAEITGRALSADAWVDSLFHTLLRATFKNAGDIFDLRRGSLAILALRLGANLMALVSTVLGAVLGDGGGDGVQERNMQHVYALGSYHATLEKTSTKRCKKVERGRTRKREVSLLLGSLT